MSTTIFYKVRIKLIRSIDGNKIDFIQEEKDFYDEQPINARKMAFQYYQNYIDVLLEGKETTYQSDRQARKIIREYMRFKNSIDDLGVGIGIFVIDTTRTPAQFGHEEFIHGIGMSYVDENPDFLMTSLQREFNIYTASGYDASEFEREILFMDRAEFEEGYDDNPELCTILETPFDWTGMDKKYWWKDDSIVDELVIQESVSPSIESLIESGESNQVEFKPALVYNFKTRAGGIGIKGIIAKTICGFLNSNGGFLFIGINDKGEPIGLDGDFSLANGKDMNDFFLLEFDDMINRFLSFNVKSNINGSFYRYKGVIIFVVSVLPSKNRPVFIKIEGRKEFFVRGEASTRQLIDIEDLMNYILDKWGK